MDCQSCLHRHSAYGRLELRGILRKPVFDVRSPVERISMRIFAPVFQMWVSLLAGDFGRKRVRGGQSRYRDSNDYCCVFTRKEGDPQILRFFPDEIDGPLHSSPLSSPPPFGLLSGRKNMPLIFLLACCHLVAHLVGNRNPKLFGDGCLGSAKDGGLDKDTAMLCMYGCKLL
jgi:hypothetical protein